MRGIVAGGLAWLGLAWLEVFRYPCPTPALLLEATHDTNIRLVVFDFYT
jgi:hypothetical protein